MKRFLVIGIDLDDADTWSIEIDAEDGNTALSTGLHAYCESLGGRAAFVDIEARYAIELPANVTKAPVIRIGEP